MPRSWVYAVSTCLLAAMLASCASTRNKFTFMRPDLTRKDSTRTAPEYDIRPDERRVSGQATRLHVARAEMRLREGKLDEAESAAREALKADPSSAEAHTLLAVVASYRGQAETAGGHYAKAAELAPQRGGVLNNYGAWLCANGRAAESLAWFERAIADPGYPTPLLARANAGACAVDAGQAQRADRDLSLVLDRDPANATALEGMARLHFNAGEFLSARAFSQRRIDAAPATPQVLRLASQIEQKLGDNQASARYLERLASEFPNGSVRAGETVR